MRRKRPWTSLWRRNVTPEESAETARINCDVGLRPAPCGGAQCAPVLASFPFGRDDPDPAGQPVGFFNSGARALSPPEAAIPPAVSLRPRSALRRPPANPGARHCGAAASRAAERSSRSRRRRLQAHGQEASRSTVPSNCTKNVSCLVRWCRPPGSEAKSRLLRRC
jgi:hypothetical protein